MGDEACPSNYGNYQGSEQMQRTTILFWVTEVWTAETGL